MPSEQQDVSNANLGSPSPIDTSFSSSRSDESIDDRRLKQAEKELVARIKQTQKEIRRIDLLAAVFAFITLAFALLLFGVVLDCWILPNGLSTRGRLCYAIFWIASASALFVCKLIPIYRRKINALFAAQTLEEAWQDKHNLTINWLQLCRAKSSDRETQSELRRAILKGVALQAVDAAQKQTEAIKLDCGNAVRWGVAFVVVVACVAGYMVFSPKNPFVGAARFIAPLADIERPQALRFQSIEPGDAVVYQGDFLEVAAEIPGADPSSVELLYSSADGRLVDIAVPMESLGLSKYSATLPNDEIGFNEDLVYRIVVSRGAQFESCSEEFTIEVRPQPSFRVEKTTLTFPEYTGLTTQTFENQGDVRAVEGTKVTVQARCNADIKRAILLPDGKRPRAQEMKIETQNPRVASSEFQLDWVESSTTEDGGSKREQVMSFYQLVSQDVDDQENRDQQEYAVSIVPDLPPTVRWTSAPEELVEVPINDALHVKLEAEDPDFSLRSAKMIFNYRDIKEGDGVKDSKTPPDPIELSFNERKNAKDYSQGPTPFIGINSISCEISPEKLGASVGDEIEYWCVVSDSKLPNPNESASEKRLFVVVEAVDQPQGVNEQTEESETESSEENSEQGPGEGQNGSQEGDSSNKEDGEGDGSQSDEGQDDAGNETNDSQGNSNDPPQEESYSNSGEDSEETGNKSENADDQEAEGNSSEQQNGDETGAGEESNGESAGEENSSESSSQNESDGAERSNSQSSSENQARNSNSSDQSSSQGEPENGDSSGDAEDAENNEQDPSQASRSSSSENAKSTTNQAFEKILDFMKQEQDKTQDESSGTNDKSQDEISANSEENATAGNGNDSQSASKANVPDSSQASSSEEEKAPNFQSDEDIPPSKDKRDLPTRTSDEKPKKDSPSYQANNPDKLDPNTRRREGEIDPDVNDFLGQNADPDAQTNNTSKNRQDQNVTLDPLDQSEATAGDSVDPNASEVKGKSGSNIPEDAPFEIDQDRNEPGENSSGENDLDQTNLHDGFVGDASSENEESNNSSSNSNPNDSESESPDVEPSSANASEQSGASNTKGDSGANSDRRDKGAGSGVGADDPGVQTLAPADAPKLQYAEQATNLALEYLEDALKKKADPRLLNELGWTEAQLREFLARWQKMRQSAESGNDQAKEAYLQALEKMNFDDSNLPNEAETEPRTFEERQRTNPVKPSVSVGETTRFKTPDRLSERVRAFTQGVSQGRTQK